MARRKREQTERGVGWVAAPWLRALLVVLFGPRRNPDRPRRLLSLATLVGPVSPGSVPFALAATAIAAHVGAVSYHEGRYALLFAVLQCGVPVVLAGYSPLAAWALLALATPAAALTMAPEPGQPWPVMVPALFSYWIVQYAVARAHRRVVSLPSWIVFVGFTFGLATWSSQFTLGKTMTALVAVFGFVWWLVGDTVRLQMTARERLAEEERLTTEERARRQVLEERARIARELHDVVAHHMSAIAVQASTATYRIDGLAEDVRREFDEIAESARGSLAEMRRLLAVLRSDDEAALRMPQPGPAGLELLAETTRRAGTPVSLDVDRVPTEVSEAVGLTVYRVVQEALSNVVRHASGAQTAVEVSASGDDVVVRVANDAPPGVGPRVEQPGPGHGLVGMRERVAVVGGTLVAGPRPDGGFQVEAVLPSRTKEGDTTS